MRLARALTRTTFSTLLSLAMSACSKGGYTGPDGGEPSGLDLRSLQDAGMRDLRPAFDLARPKMRTTVSFAPGLTYAAGDTVYGIAAGRINKDEYLDIVVASGPEPTVYMNRGDGTFDVKPQSLGHKGDWQIVCADFNRDGLSDIAYVDSVKQVVVVAFSSGDGTMRPASTHALGGRATSVVATDLNNDGAPDLVAGSYDNNAMSLFLNKGDGTFREGPSYLTAGSSPIHLTAGDIDRDGKVDIVMSDYYGDQLRLFLSNGDGTLQPARTIASPQRPVGISLGDIDLDGDLDLAAARETGMAIEIFLNDGAGKFTAGTPLKLSSDEGQGIQLVDLNDDGILDVLAATAMGGNAHVFLGRGDATFEGDQNFPGGPGTAFFILGADFNNDGLADIAIPQAVSNNLIVRLNATVR